MQYEINLVNKEEKEHLDYVAIILQQTKAEIMYKDHLKDEFSDIESCGDSTDEEIIRKNL